MQSGQIDDGQVVISGDDAHHITRVLRLRVGDEIEGVDVTGQVYRIRLHELGSEVLGFVVEKVEYEQESPLDITLFQGLAKGDKMDLVVQKAVELGVKEIVPFTSRFTVVKLAEKQIKTRQARWERIALEAAKQSGRTRLPAIRELHTFSQLTATVKERYGQGDLAILAYEGE
ncbi:MAG TPA: RsmE family RNA methyltransferase, partial [Limnochordia bacterium]|nr:RsmE family RNA methyltransferase [Limnochordia bacterium]